MSSAETSRIIVLHQTKYSENSLIVHAIDSRFGRQGFLLRGAGRKSGSRVVSEFHSLNVLDVVSSGNPESGLRHLREWETVRPLLNLRTDIFKSSVALFISEVLYRSLTAGASDEGLFEWLCSVILRLDSAECCIANFHLWFLASFCQKMGFGPESDFEPKEIFSDGEAALLKKLVSGNFEDAMAVPLNGRTRSGFSGKMVQYLSYHLGIRLEIRSLDVLHELFNR